MPLRFAKVSADGHGLVRGRIEQLPDSSKHPQALELAEGVDSFGPPHDIYEIRIQDILAGKALRNCARRRGERYLAFIAGEPAAAAEVHRNARGCGRHFVEVNIGPLIGGSHAAFGRLGADPRLTLNSFDITYLRCRLIYLAAIWLRADNEVNDLVYPLPHGAPIPLQAEQLYSLMDFEEILQALIRKRYFRIST